MVDILIYSNKQFRGDSQVLCFDFGVVESQVLFSFLSLFSYFISIQFSCLFLPECYKEQIDLNEHEAKLIPSLPIL